MKPIVSSIHFSPIKSLSFQSINTAIIKKDIGFEEDRIFAFSRAIDSSLANTIEKDPSERELIHFLTLKNTPALNKYDFKFENGMISISENNKQISTHPIEDKEPISKEISKLEPNLAGPIYFLKNELFPFYDTTNGSHVSNTISLINLNSIKDFNQKINKEIEFQRFRGNIYIKDLDAFEERNWINKTIKINEAEFSATNLKINSDQVDINLPNELKKVYGHMDMGIYLYPLNNGKISVNDEINIS
jgi:uncharacterized protein YcbX